MCILLQVSKFLTSMSIVTLSSQAEIFHLFLFLHAFKIIFQRFCFFLQKPNLLGLSFSFCLINSEDFMVFFCICVFCNLWHFMSKNFFFVNTEQHLHLFYTHLIILNLILTLVDVGPFFFFVIFFCIYQLPRVSQTGFFIYLSTFKKC